MYGLLVLWALVGAVLGAPSNCVDPCSTLGDQLPARLEDFGGSDGGGAGSLPEPNGPSGTWRDEKHFVTDDGKAQMSFQAGETVGDNGSTKFASHSYRYASQGSQPARPDAQVLSPDEFKKRQKQLEDSVLGFAGPDSTSLHLDQLKLMQQQLEDNLRRLAGPDSAHFDPQAIKKRLDDYTAKLHQSRLHDTIQQLEQLVQGSRCRRDSIHQLKSHLDATVAKLEKAVDDMKPVFVCSTEHSYASTVQPKLDDGAAKIEQVKTLPLVDEPMRARLDAVQAKYRQFAGVVRDCATTNSPVIIDENHPLLSLFDENLSHLREDLTAA